MRTNAQIESEACLRATQATAMSGIDVESMHILYQTMENQYWDDWSKAYDEALVDLEDEQ